MELDAMLAYTDWLMNRVADACRALPTGLFTAPTVFPNGHALGLGSLCDTFLHMAQNEHRWVGLRFHNLPYRPAREQFPPDDYRDVERVVQLWRSGRALTTHWLAEHQAELDTPREFEGIFGKTTLHTTPRHVLLHTLTHTISHRGDITSQFSFLGAEPPELDYIVFVQLSER